MPDLSGLNLIHLFQAIGAISLLIVIRLLITDSSKENKILHANVENQRLQIAELLNAVQYLSQTTEDLKQEKKQLRKEIDIRGLYDGATDAHLQAINSARAGASAKDIAENYNLIAAEAELIVSMHGKQNQQRKH
ncbi:MAG TPA: DUF2802 domain-containing protein [Chromatiales bacterium]|nr:DUF2802 domain-containing protein [Thiotrichales bacterium]HIP68517.1 DUF2802 domain-containing protein [Chromatiales bacterium]